MSNQLRAAVGKVIITPEEKCGLQGFDPNTCIANPPEDILDDLFARILLLDDGNRRSVIVSVDCCLSNEGTVVVPLIWDETGRREFIATFPSDTRVKWAEAAGTDVNSAFVMATHTHSAPAHFSEKYTRRVQHKIAELAQHLEPVKLSICQGHSAISAYRRPALHPNFDVEIDQSLYVVLFETESGKPLGALVNYAVHPTILHPPAPANRVSTEHVGWAMNELEEEIGGGFVALFAQGFSGDVAPVLPGKAATEDTDTYGNVRKAGHQLYLDVKQAMLTKKSLETKSFIVKQQWLNMPTVPGFEQQFVLSGLALGELVLLCGSGEIFNEFVNKVKAASPFPYTLPISHTNGYSGYLPTQKAYHDGLGGYEMATTPYKESADAVFNSAAESLLRELYSSSR